MENFDQINGKKNRAKLVAIIAIVILLFLVFVGSSIIAIYRTEVGVVKILGKVQDKPLQPGLHFANPLITEVVRMPTYEKTMELVGVDI